MKNFFGFRQKGAHTRKIRICGTICPHLELGQVAAKVFSGVRTVGGLSRRWAGFSSKKTADRRTVELGYGFYEIAAPLFHRTFAAAA